MSRRCELTGKGPLAGQIRSHGVTGQGVTDE